MKSLIPRMMTAVSTVAFTLAVGGCGGGSSKTPAAPAPEPVSVDMAMVTQDGADYMDPEAGEFTIGAGESKTRGSVTFTCAAGGEGCTVMVAADGMATATGGVVTAMHSTAYQSSLDRMMNTTTLSDLETSTRTLTTLANNDARAEGSARAMAMKYARMLGTLASDGNSLAETANARKVLEARAMLVAAKTDAETKKTAAEAARTGLADDDPLVNLFDGAIMRADAQIEVATVVLEERGAGSLASHVEGAGSLASHVERVTGTEMDNPKTPAGRGREVAMAIARALQPRDGADGAGLRVVHGTTLPGDAVAMANRHTMNDSRGKTFAMIVGEENLMETRISTGASAPATTRAVKAASFAGMPAASITSGTPEAGDVPDGREYGGPQGAEASYRGIPGVVFCAGTCKVEDVSGTDTLTGSWYFAPADPMAYYMVTSGRTNGTTAGATGGEVTYTVDTMYAIWGHWLATEDGGGSEALRVNTFARLGGDADGRSGNPGSWSTAIPTHDDAGMKMTAATYNGSAASRSVQRTIDADGMVANIQSGNFMADVMLTARFGANPAFGGTIDNFRAAEGSNPGAVDTSWTVRLMETAAPGGTVAATDGGAGVTMTTGRNGKWSATSYGASAADATGDDARRPAGVYGGFNAHFTDGHVAGAYGTRKR